MVKKIACSFFILLMLAACTPKPSRENLFETISGELEKQSGVFAVAFKDLSTDETLLFHGEERFHAASTMKVPVMIEVFKQAAEGKFSMRDSMMIKNEFKSIVDGSLYALDPADDSELELYKQLGAKKTIADLVYDMIIVSSNLATNLVIELVDAKNVTSTMRTLGAKDIEVLRGVEDQKAFEKGMINSVTAFDLMTILTGIAKSETVNTEASDAMIKILLDQKFNDIIPANLPKDVKVAHKTGFITGVHHDAGIIFLPDGRKYVLVLLSKEMKDADSGTKAMAKVSELVYNHVTSH